MEHQELVRIIARRCHKQLPRWLELDDLISAGQLGLIEAADKYDPGRGVPFKLYASQRIRGAIIDANKRRNYTWELHLALDSGGERGPRATVGQAEDDGHARPPAAAATQHERVEAIERRQWLIAILRKLPIARRKVASTYLTGQLLREYGESHGVSKSGACHLRKAAIAELRAIFEAEGLRLCDLL